jgi:nitroimidazol reductase NimA-like FMN-containing flavoprotein (pyridoxamine 5'-phosphate oxidase superfamily)
MSGEKDHTAVIARAIVDANRYMTLATADSDGRPWACPVFYAAADYSEFYWISALGATHSRNLAQRPQISIVIFDSGVPEGTGQAVYMSATAEQVPADELVRGLAVYPGPAEPGWPPLTLAQLQAPAPHRLYRATVFEHSILCPRGQGPCAPHGLAFDHRVPVRLEGPSR